MSELTRESLVGIARQFYPAGFPAEAEDQSEPVPAYQRTHEHERFMAAWEKALAWPEWKKLMKELPHAFPGMGVGSGTQPFVSACLRCFVYRVEPMPGGKWRRSAHTLGSAPLRQSCSPPVMKLGTAVLSTGLANIRGCKNKHLRGEAVLYFRLSRKSALGWREV